MSRTPSQHDFHDDPHLEAMVRAGLQQASTGAASKSPDCPDAMTLAAWMDDRLGTSHRDAVDRHLTRCSACVHAVHSARLALEDAAGFTSPPVTPLEVERVLVAVDPYRTRLQPAEVITTFRWQRVAAAAILIVACWAGYQLGRGTPVLRESPRNDVCAAMTFGLIEEEDERDALLSFVMHLAQEDR